MRHVYVVTRIHMIKTQGVVEIPNLGMHSSRKKADSHFDNVVEDRKKREHVVREQCYEGDGRDNYTVVRSAYCAESQEQIRLEKWKLR